MRPDLERPAPADLPLVGNVEPLSGAKTGIGQEAYRDEAIIDLLRRKLKERSSGNIPVTGGRRAGDKRVSSEEDKYEPQRINRKICWQYDNTARKIPLLRRHYI
jgi:hypothetical protein